MKHPCVVHRFGHLNWMQGNRQSFMASHALACFSIFRGTSACGVASAILELWKHFFGRLCLWCSFYINNNNNEHTCTIPAYYTQLHTLLFISCTFYSCANSIQVHRDIGSKRSCVHIIQVYRHGQHEQLRSYHSGAQTWATCAAAFI